MRDPNPRIRSRERFEISLDGRQVASIVVGALVILGVVFVLGLNVGKQIGMRQAELAVAPGDLDALDRAPAAPPAAKEPLTFHDRLTKEAPAAPPPAPPPTPPPAAAATPPPAATPPAEAPTPAPAPGPVESAPPAEPPPDRPWTVQLAAAQDRAEAERTAARFAALNPRIEQADVPGKGRFWRVRVGAFETREAAERYLRDVGRETGARGFVTPSR
ncbi:MAG TPA: SPOR domain-containing protein [Anaeromyxobacter sp.]|nr:SPOR domain-containing protein [Anaeromyxobacter sp.]